MEITALPLVAALGVAGYHLWRTLEAVRGRLGGVLMAHDGEAERRDWLRRKRRRLEDLKELAFDFEAGKLEPDVYEGLKRELEQRVVRSMMAIDALDEVEVRSRRIEEELQRALAQATHCSGCGASRETGGDYCARCGAAHG